MAAATIADGQVVKAEGGTSLYLIADGLKHWINSPDTLHAQGLEQEPIQIVSAVDLAAIPEGDRITADSYVVLPDDEPVLPDLSPLPPEDLSLETVNGRKVIRFTAKFWNDGGGPLELVTSGETLQRIVRTNGSERLREVGEFVWHASHDHYHYSDFADYTIAPVRLPTGVIGQAVTQKTTFCMRDNEDITGATADPIFTDCNQYQQGVSVGWADVYEAYLPDQYIDVNDLPAGTYQLSFVIDPRGYFVEGDRSNNTSFAIVELDAAQNSLTVLAAGSTYALGNNDYTDGMLVRGDQDPGVFVMHHNRKFPLRTEDMFTSRGFDWEDIYWLPQNVVDAIPNAPFRADGSDQVYALNAEGFRRRVLSPVVFDSYGWELVDVYAVSADELAGYPDSDVVVPPGSDEAFSLSTKQRLGLLTSLATQGYNSDQIHHINEADFKAYGVKTIATGLDVPWDIAFLPGGDMLVTERSGTLQRLGSAPMTYTIPAVADTGEGGLMGIALHPDFATNNFVYLYYTTSDNQRNRITRFTLNEVGLTLDKIIFDGIPSAIYHDGGQIAFGPDGMLYATTGDANTPANAPDLNSFGGKTLRLTPEGDVPSDNPFGTAVWSYGHRNAQSLAWDNLGRLWETEHGRSGALSGYDELNLIQRGGNYGWSASQGDLVLPGTIGPARHSGATNTWAPSGMAYADDTLYFAGLRGESVYAANINAAGQVTAFNDYLVGEYGRLRAVVLGPDGFLYVTTSNRDGRGVVGVSDDQIIQIAPDFLR